MRSHRRRLPLEHILVAGDLTEVDSIKALLALMPDSAYGQVYVELDDLDELPAIPAPPRVAVNPIVRGAHQDAGEPLAAAVASWVSEWMPDEPAPERVVSIWAGAAITDGVPTQGTRLERL